MAFFYDPKNQQNQQNQQNNSGNQNGQQYTSFQVMQRIGQLYNTDKNQATELYTAFTQLQNDPTSPYYQPYKNATNPAVSNLQAMGVDVSNLDDNWFDQNAGLKDYYIYSGTTTTPAKPGAKATQLQKAAYEYYQLDRSRSDTKAMDSEWQELQRELGYWATREDRNYSDDEIINKINWNKYPTLNKMNNSSAGNLVELNHGTDYSPDAMRGVIWNARNGKNDDITTATYRSAFGVGKQWQENPEISAKLNPETDDYSPYSVGSTMEEEGLYFGVSSFDQQWIDDHRYLLNSNDPMAKKMYQNVLGAEQFTQTLERELDEMHAQIDEMLTFYANDPDELLSILRNNRDYQDLFSLDPTMDPGSKDITNLKNTTRAVDYKWSEIEAYVRQKCEDRMNQPSVMDTVQNMIGTFTQAVQQIHGNVVRTFAGYVAGEQPEQAAPAAPETPETAPASAAPETAPTTAATPAPTTVKSEAEKADEQLKKTNLANAGATVNAAGTPAEKTAYAGGSATGMTVPVEDLSKADFKPETMGSAAQTGAQESAKASVSSILVGDEVVAKRAKQRLGTRAAAAEASGVTQIAMPGVQSEEDAFALFRAAEQAGEILNNPLLGEGIEFELDRQKTYPARQAYNSYLLNGDPAGMTASQLQAKVRLLGGQIEDAEARKEQVEAARQEEISRLYDMSDEEKYTEVYNMLINDDGNPYNSTPEKGVELIARLQDQWEHIYRGTYDADLFDAYTEEQNMRDLYDWINHSENVGGSSAYDEMMDSLDEEKQEEFQEKIRNAIRLLMPVDRLNGTYFNSIGDEDREIKRLQDEIQKTYQQEERQATVQRLTVEAMQHKDASYHAELSGASEDYRLSPESTSYAGSEAAQNNGSQYMTRMGYYYLNDERTNRDDHYESWATQDEKETFNRLYNAGEFEKAQEYLDALTPTLRARRAAEYEEVNRANASGDWGWFYGLTSVPSNIIQGFTGSVGIIAALLGDEEARDPNSKWWDYTRYTSITRDERGKSWDWQLQKWFGEGVAGVGMFVNGVCYSIFDNLAAVGAGKLVGKASEVSQGMVQIVMSAEASATAMMENLEKGLDPTEAAFRAIMSGAIEAITEKYSIEALLDASVTEMLGNKKAILKFLAKNMIAEGCEEGASDVLNLAADVVMSALYGHDNEIEKKIKAFEADGKDHDDAVKAAWKEIATDTLKSMAAGSLSGFIMSGGRQFINSHNARSAGKVVNRSNDSSARIDALTELAETEYNQDSNTYKSAQKVKAKRAKGRKVGNYEIGMLGANMKVEAKSDAVSNAVDRVMNPYFKDAQGKITFSDPTKAITDMRAEEKAARRAGIVESEQAKAQRQAAKDLTILDETSGTQDAAAASANVAAVVKAETDTHTAVAVGQKIVTDMAGGDTHVAAQVVAQTIKAAGNQSTQAVSAAKTDIAWAAMTDGAAHEVLNGMVITVANGEKVTELDLQDLRTAVETDMAGENGKAMQAQFDAAVRDSRIANRMNEIMGANPMDSVLRQEAVVADKQETLNRSEAALDEARDNRDAVAQNMVATTEEAMKDPTNGDMAAEQQHVTAQLAGAVDQQNQAEEAAEASRKNLEAAQQELDSTREQEMGRLRQQAAAEVDAEIAQEQAAEETRKAEEARMQAEEEERTGEAFEKKRDALIEDLLNRDQLEGEERDAMREKYLQMADQIKLKKIDMTGLMNNTEGYLAVMQLSRKLGVIIQTSTDLGNARGKYENGVIYLNQNLIKNGKMTIGQALVEASLHEITHDIQKTGAYQKYAKIVEDALFGGDEAKRAAAIEQKKQEYLKNVGQTLDDPAAMKEIVADYARTHLNSKDVVDRLCAEGFGGRIKNTLHNINQALKNFNLKGDDKIQAEYLRRAERMFQKALNEQARKQAHPEGGQFSVMQVAQATGMRFDDKLNLYNKEGKLVDGVEIKIEPKDMEETPVGMLINAGLSSESPGVDENGNRIDSPQEAAKKMMAGLMNLVAQYKDSNLIWEIGASTLNSTFSAIKSNSDPQYKTTVDFGTVCAKTQAIVDVMSRVMLDKIDPETGLLKEGATRGLNRKDVMTVYNEVHKAGLSVPCPVCYVFSRWMGVPSLIGQMSQYQHDYVALETGEDGKPLLDKNGNYVINKAETQKNVDRFLEESAKYGDAKAINKKKADLQGKLAKLDKRHDELRVQLRDKNLSAEEKENIRKEIEKVTDDAVALEKQIGEVAAYNWITQALCKEQDGKYVVDDKFVYTPDAILFDLNRTGEFAGYEKNWAYRNTRGAGMGKAIMPYSGETIGDILYGVNSDNKGRRQSSIRNPWLNMDAKTAARQLKNATDRAKKQNLVGGQRLQSTSDFRPEWGLDYIMSFLELQAAKSKVQMYTKVAEAVDLFASVGADVNLSIMGEGQGWHLDENGNPVLDFSSITGMNFETAKDLKNKYDNVQMILVGMNDTHIRLALANEDIDFVIPWHSSGNSKDVLAGLIGAVGEKLNASVDYTTTQSDMVKGTKKSYYDENGKKVEYTVPGEQTEEQKALWDARVKLLTKGGSKLTQAERETLLRNPVTRGLYYRFTLQKGQTATYDGVTYSYDPECSNVKLTGDQAKQIFPYEYWDTSLTKADADQNGQRFVDYCESMGIVPRFSQFKDDPGYWKLLIDRPMYDNNGNYRSQQTIDVTKAKIGNLNEQGQLENSDLPTQAQAKYAPKDPRNPNYAKYNEMEDTAFDNAKAAIEEQYDDGSEGQYSVYGDMTMADMEQMMADIGQDYADAVSRGDMEAAMKDLDFVAESKGFDTDELAYHGTDAFGFTTFDTDKGDGTIFVCYNFDIASTYSEMKQLRTIKTSQLNMLTDKQIVNRLGRIISEMNNGTSMTYDESTGEIRFTHPDENGQTVTDVVSRDDALAQLQEYVDLAKADERHQRGMENPTKSQRKLASGVYQLYTRPGNNVYVIDAKGAKWNKIAVPWSDQLVKTRDIGKWAKENGYSSVRINNVYDVGKYFENIPVTGAIERDIGIFFDPNDVKSADPATYDDNGKLIPIEERFQDDNPDIRYSMGGDVTLADMEQMLYAKPSFSDDDVSRVQQDAEKSFASEFAKEYSAWNKTEKGKVFKLGKPNETFLKLGVPDKEMAMTSDKLIKIKEKHHGMSDDVIKQIPSIVDKPVLIMKSDSVDGRLVVFGEVMNDDGFPVLAALSTNLQQDSHTGDDFVLLNSAYGKDFLLQNFINKGEILYKDENRADTWAAGLRLELPSASAVIGSSDNKIAQNGTGVNSTMEIYNDKAFLKESTVDRWLKDYAASNPNYAQAYIAYIDPNVFVDLTTVKMDSRRRIYDEAGTLNEEKMQDISPENPMFLRIDGKTGEIYGHEGRHRAVAMSRAGVKQVPVLVFDFDSKYSKTHQDSLLIRGQSFDDGFKNHNKTTLHDVIPLSTGNRNEIVEKFGVTESDELDAQNSGKRNLQYSTGGEQTAADMEQKLLESGLFTEEEVAAYRGNTGTDVSIPGTETGGPQRQFGSKTAQESDALHDEVKDYLYNNSSYTPDTNKAQIDRSIGWVKSLATEEDPDGYHAAVQAVTSGSFDYRSADGQARMLTAMSMAAVKAETAETAAERQAALDDEMRIADAYNKQGTDLGRQLQARKIFRLMTPLGRRATIQKMADEINDQYAREGKTTKVGLSEWTMRAAENAKTEEDFRKVQKAAAKEIAEQMPANWRDKMRAFRMLSMLGNPRTHIRNIIGNAMFIPAVSLKNKMGALAEIATGQKERTKTLRPVLSADVREFARKDAEAMKDTLTGEAKYNEDNMVQQERKPLKGFLQWLIDFNSNMLETEDWIFLKGHYRRALGGWMQANGYTAEQLQNDKTLLEKGRSYAVEEAQKATYRDFSKVASILNDVSRKGGVAGFVVDAALPFKKTPANILKRGIEYSPLGIAKSLTVDMKHMKQYLDYQDGKLKTLPDKALSPNQVIDHICAGLSGTAVMALGFLLSGAGIVTAGLDEPEDELEKLKGNQEYSVKFNLFGQDVTFTMDWAAPMSMPFFVGASIREQTEGGGDLDIEQAVNAIGKISEPVFNLSMLDGVNSLFRTSQNDETNTLTQILAKIGTNYATSYVPSIFGAVARTIDTNRRKAFVESGKGTGPLGTVRYAIEQAENKIPGLSQTNIPYRDVFGRAEESGLGERLLENFVLPGYISEYRDDDVVYELGRLYDVSGGEEKALIPKYADKKINLGVSVTDNPREIILTDKEWDTYHTTRGQTAYRTLEKLFETDYYKNAGDLVKIDMVKEVWEYATAEGKKAVAPDYTPKKDYGDDPVQKMIDDRTEESRKNALKKRENDMMTSLDNSDYEGFEACVQDLRDAGIWDDKIRQKVRDNYRDAYKNAYREQDYAAMYEIEQMLDNAGVILGGYQFPYKDWRKDVEKEQQ